MSCNNLVGPTKLIRIEHLIADVAATAAAAGELANRKSNRDEPQAPPPAEFERWRTWTTSIYRLGSGVCFLRVIFHQGWAIYLSRNPVTTPGAPKAMVVPALIMDVLFLSVVAITFVRASRARNLRRELGIVLSPMTPQQAAAAAEDDDGSSRKDG